MTHIDELVKRARDIDEEKLNVEPWTCEQLFKTLADALEAQAARVKELEALCDRLKLEAQIHSGEARAHKSTVHECYQAASGATGEPGNWHGAAPVRDRIAAQAAQLEAFREATVNVVKFLDTSKSGFRISSASDEMWNMKKEDIRDALMSALHAEGEKDGD